MSIIIKIGNTDYTNHDENYSCDNCEHSEERRLYKEENPFSMGGFPQYHPCQNCKDFSDWKCTRRHLGQVIEYLQNELDTLRKEKV